MVRRAWRDGGEALASDVAARGGVDKIDGTAGDDRLTGTAGADRFNLADGGADFVKGFAGDDVFVFGDTFTADDRVNGGEGFDKLFLNGDYSEKLVLDPDQIKSIEKLVVANEGPYNLEIMDGFADFSVLASYKTGVDRLELDASQLTTGSLFIRGGSFDDTIVGGSQDDKIIGGTGGDVLTGGRGDDTFVYGDFIDSKASSPDLVTDFSKGDRLKLPTYFTDHYYVGETAGHAGDVIVSYSTEVDQTRLEIFTAPEASLIILLSGKYNSLEIVNGNFIVVA